MSIVAIGLGLLVLILAGVASRTRRELRAEQERFRPIVDLEAEQRRLKDAIALTQEAATAALETERHRAAQELAQSRNAAARERLDEQARLEAHLARAKADSSRAIAVERKQVAAACHRMHEDASRATVAAARSVADAEAKRQQLRMECHELEESIVRLREQLRPLDEETILLACAFYKPVYAFSTVAEYESRLDEIRKSQKSMLQNKQAATCAIQWEVNGSKAEGKKQIDRTLKLMLRAFNGEADACIAKVTYKNIKTMEARLKKAADAINDLTNSQHCTIASSYVSLKSDELRLAYEYAERLQRERDEQRRIREQMREEEAAQRELEKAKLEAEREAKRDAEALARARLDYEKAKGPEQQRMLERIAELERRVAEDLEKQRAISQAQLTRTGHVYVISNIGSFGEGVYKLGMTRRLVPQDRIDELGDASVPFEFDVHAIIRTSDAPALESALHRTFTDRRVNRINERKEFFRVSLEEIATAVRKHHGEFELTQLAEAAEYRKTLALLEEERSKSIRAVA
ncbi:DUF4041 domain-containing protein [Corallococcus sp. ZKHCc1 1396]|uniref:DUF4041 domain-containing protein n=1 Tax=Corallococcus soli TaxID=2710757 RepID=A0ABR9PU80_9BACT|nr:DUF4041 domain-containing protein [Corallococcus soli]MBE4751493.1 DUF4041 domain-containing protein [Corallococcus soli]